MSENETVDTPVPAAPFHDLAQLLEAMAQDPGPDNGVCHHLGIHSTGFLLGGKRVSVGIMPNTKGTLVTVYFASSLESGSARMWSEVRTRIAEATQSAVADSWNGEEGNSGISVVIDQPAPTALANAIQRYRSQPSVFNPTPEIQAGYQAFNLWLAKKREQVLPI